MSAFKTYCYVVSTVLTLAGIVCMALPQVRSIYRYASPLT